MVLLASLAAVLVVSAPAHAQPTYGYSGSGQSIIELLGYKPGLVFYVDPRGDQVNYMKFTVPPGKTYTSAGLEYDHTAYDNTVAHTAMISLLSGEPTADAAGMAEIRTGPFAGTVPVQSPRNVGVANLSPAVVTRMNSLSASGGGVLYLGGHAPLDATYIFAEFTSVKLVGNTNEPGVTAVSPATGSAAGGRSVVITGLNFTGATSVVFGAAAASFVVNSSTQISATAPAGTDTVDIRVTTPVGTSATSAADRFTYLSAKANLSALSLSAGVLSPVFASATTSYTASVSNATTSLTVTPTVADATASVTVNGVAVTSGNVSGAIALNVGSNTITVAVTAQDGTTTQTYTITVSRGSPPVASSFTASAVAYNPGWGAATTFSVAGQATGNPTSYVVTSATTTNGGTVFIDNSGLVTYRPAIGFRGADRFQYNASNAAGTSASATVTVPVRNPIFVVSLAGSGTRAAPLTGVVVNASGGRAPYNCATTLISGALPAGTQLNADCTISGTPAASGTFNFTVSVTDSSIGTGPYTATSGTLSLVLASPTVSQGPAAGALLGAQAGAAYSQTITASGGTAPYTYAVTAGSLPAGLTLDSGGALSGTPSATGSFSFTITTTDSSSFGSGGPYTSSAAYTLAVAAPPIAVGPTILTAANAGTAYSQTISASGGASPYSYAVTGGSLPTGLTLSPGGALAGTPTAAGIYGFTITATDSSTGSGVRGYTLTVNAALPVAPTAIPTLSEWAMIFFGTILAGGAALFIERRRKTTF